MNSTSVQSLALLGTFHRGRRWLAQPILLGLAVLMASPIMVFAPPTALAETSLTCESVDNKTKYCSIDTTGGVRLTKQLSNSRCELGESWGYNQNRVWVSKGCRARFSVGAPVDHANEDNDDGEGLSTGQKVAVGAGVAGLAALGYALYKGYQNKKEDEAAQQQASQYNPPPQYNSGNTNTGTYNSGSYNTSSPIVNPGSYSPYGSTNTPTWVTGQFRGFDPLYNVNVDMIIEPTGTVTRSVAGQQVQGDFRQGTIHINGFQWSVQPEGNGFRTINQENPNNQVVFQRVQ